jgi:CxxC motif-containing protein (DUF1111 family)
MEFVKWKCELVQGGFPTPLVFRAEDRDAETQQIESLGASSQNFGQSIFSSREVGAANIELIASQRNTPSLFGVGLIDGISDRVLEEVAASQARAMRKGGSEEGESKIPCPISGEIPLPVSGRVARLRDGRVGRFGWKAQTASLREFTLQACAIELGLEVPGFPQTPAPWKAGYKAPRLDLSAEQCDALISFVAALPPPSRKPPETAQHAAEISAGQKLFTRAGCAVCHQPKLGDVDGIYSDLLLHDMGQTLSGDGGSYGGSSVPGKGPSDGVDPLPMIVGGEEEPREKRTPKFGAAAREWRTPPLWGLRDSAPYLHDGRAFTVSAAIAFHDGEGAESAQQFFRLSLRERQQVELFLQSLGVPR